MIYQACVLVFNGYRFELLLFFLFFFKFPFSFYYLFSGMSIIRAQFCICFFGTFSFTFYFKLASLFFLLSDKSQQSIHGFPSIDILRHLLCFFRGWYGVSYSYAHGCIMFWYFQSKSRVYFFIWILCMIINVDTVPNTVYDPLYKSTSYHSSLPCAN